MASPVYLLLIAIIAPQFLFGIDAEEDNSSIPLPPGDFDESQFAKLKEQVCSRVPAFTGGDPNGGSKWSDTITENEILELAFVNMAYGLTTDSVTHLRSELGWKKTVIDLISLITKASCTDVVISEPFLNAAKNLFLYYLVKIQTKSGNSNDATSASLNVSEARVEEWKEVIKSLTDCANAVVPIDIATNCGKAVSFSGKDGSSVEIKNTNERFDEEMYENDVMGLNNNMGLDVIVDTVWWMFSTTYARCYAYFYPNEDVILVFFQMFRQNFLVPFLNRWRNGGPMAEHFPIVFGPFDFATSASNARSCCSASYQYEGLAERQLVRPVTVVVNNTEFGNFKILDKASGLE